MIDPCIHSLSDADPFQPIPICPIYPQAIKDPIPFQENERILEREILRDSHGFGNRTLWQIMHLQTSNQHHG
jgi:hypothetical protein